MAVLAACVGPREGAAPAPGEVRTKNGALSFIFNLPPEINALVASNTLRSTTTMGSVGYPLRVEFSGIDPAFDAEFGTTTANCSIDSLSGVLSYRGLDRGTCSVWVVQKDVKRGGSTAVTFVPPAISPALTRDLIGYFPFNDATSLGWNAVTKRVDLNVVGGVAFRQQGRFGGAAYFNGRDGVLLAKGGSNKNGSLTGLPSGNSPYAISAWIRPTEFANGGLVGWGKFDGKTSLATMMLRMNDTKRPAADEVWGGLTHVWWGADQVYKHNQPVCCTESFTQDKWVHVAVTYDGKTRTIYYRGKAVASDEPKLVNAVTNENFIVGGSMGNPGDFFTGRMDDVAVWKRSLSAQEVGSLANGSVATPSAELGAGFVPFTPAPCDQPGGYCDVGDKAPDGGTVFYVGNFIDQLTNQPMRYIAHAPNDLQKQVHGPGTAFLTGYESNCGGEVHPIPETDRNEIGAGRRNTVLIRSFCEKSAAAEAMDLSIGGSKDWFIPSENELNELCKFARNQVTGDPSVGCSSKLPVGAGWPMDRYHGYFLSSSQGSIIDSNFALFSNIVGSFGGDWAKIAVLIAEKAGIYSEVDWGSLQAWRLGRNFLNGERYNDDGQASQVRPVRYFAPGAQLPLALEPASGVVGEPVKFVVSGGSGAGAITYRVTDTGTAACATSGDRARVIASSVGTCSVVASKAGSGSFRVARTPATQVTIDRGTQAALTLGTPSIAVGDSTKLSVGGGSGAGAVTLKIADAGTTSCRVSNPTSGANEIVASAPGTCRVTIDKAGDTNYRPAASVTVDVKVAKKDQAALSITGSAGVIDTRISLATSGGSGSGAVTYAVAPGGTSDCSVVASGPSIVAERPGTCRITATKAGDAVFQPATSNTADFTFDVVTCNEDGVRTDGSACQVGDVGPGGGRVFYVSPTPIDYAEGISTGGTFLEVAPSGWFGNAGEYSNAWCRSGKVGVALKAAIGDGADNTFRVAMAGGCAPESAMRKVAEATIGGKSDWFVPSIKELNEVCKFAYRQAGGDPAVNCAPNGPIRADFVGLAGPGFGTWSSTEVVGGGYTQNYSMNLKTGPSNYDISIEGTGSFYSVRPIRAFGAKKPPTTVPPEGFAPTTAPSPTTAAPATTSTLPIEWVCDNSGKRQDGTACKVGDTGPAGGRVIHQTTVVLNAIEGISKGGKYFELAPAGWSGTPADPSMAVGCDSGSTKTDRGLGASLTKAILDICPNGTGAAQTAANLSITKNGVVYDDWFLPSRGEIARISETKVANLGLSMGGNYMTSSFNSTAGQVWLMSVSFDWPGGIASPVASSTTAFVRPIRAFG